MSLLSRSVVCSVPSAAEMKSAVRSVLNLGGVEGSVTSILEMFSVVEDVFNVVFSVPRLKRYGVWSVLCLFLKKNGVWFVLFPLLRSCEVCSVVCSV